MSHGRLTPTLLTVALAATASVLPAQTFGTFNAARGGSISWPSGDLVDEAAAALAAAFPTIPVLTTDVLTAEFLASIDVVVLSAPTAGSAAITPLSAAEQQALAAFVQAGGAAVLFADNDTFAGSPASDLANESLLDPFGLDMSQTFNGTQPITLTGGANPLANGPFGPATAITGGWIGTFDVIGGGTVLGTASADGRAAVVALQFGGGRVLAFGDVTWATDGFLGQGNNQVVLLNALAWAAIPEPGTWAAWVGASALAVAALRRRRR